MVTQDKTLYNYHRERILSLVEELRKKIYAKIDSLDDSFEGIKNELVLDANIQADQADQILSLILDGNFSVADLRHLGGSLYMKNLELRWLLEIQTDEFRQTMENSGEEITEIIDEALIKNYEENSDDAVRLLVRITKKHPENYALLMNLGVVFFYNIGNYDLAEKIFKKAVKSPCSSENKHFKMLAIHFLVATLIEKDKHLEALSLLQNIESTGQKTGPLFYSICQLYSSLNQQDNALKYLNKALKMHGIYFGRAVLDPALANLQSEVFELLIKHDKAFKKLADIVCDTARNTEEKILAISHCNNPERAQMLKEEIEKKCSFKDIIIVQTAGLSSLYVDNQGIILTF